LKKSLAAFVTTLINCYLLTTYFQISMSRDVDRW